MRSDSDEDDVEDDVARLSYEHPPGKVSSPDR